MIEDVDVTNAKVVTREVIVEVPKFVEKIIEVIKIVEVPKEVEVPEFVTKIIEVDEVKIVPKVIVKEIEQERVKWIDVEREHIVEKAIFRDRIVDVIKPRYACQSCGAEV